MDHFSMQQVRQEKAQGYLSEYGDGYDQEVVPQRVLEYLVADDLCIVLQADESRLSVASKGGEAERKAVEYGKYDDRGEQEQPRSQQEIVTHPFLL